jgi:hypothetical protein
MTNFISLCLTVKTNKMECDGAEGREPGSYLMVAADQSTPCKEEQPHENSEIT